MGGLRKKFRELLVVAQRRHRLVVQDFLARRSADPREEARLAVFDGIQRCIGFNGRMQRTAASGEQW